MSLYSLYCAETLLRQKCDKQKKMPQTYVKKVIYPYHKL